MSRTTSFHQKNQPKRRQKKQRAPHPNTMIHEHCIVLAVQHHNAGRVQQAEALYQQVLNENPKHPTALHLLGVLARDVGQHEVAIKLIKKAIVAQPEFPEAHNNLAVTYKKLGRLDDALMHYRKAVAIDPDNAVAQYNLGNTLKDLGLLDEAVDHYQKATCIDSEFALAHYNLGIVLGDLGKMEESIDCFEQAILFKPDYSKAHFNLGYSQQVLGYLDKSVTSYRAALAHLPSYAEAYRCLANIKKFTKYNQDIQMMEKLYAQSDLNDEQRMHVAFGLGKAFEDLGEYEKAFDFLLTGNALKHKMDNFSIERTAESFEQTKKTFSKSLFSNFVDAGNSDPTPIFILGMPRSGTTLVEQIIATHPDVFGAGELPYVSQIFKSFLSNKRNVDPNIFIHQAKAEDFTQAGEDYVTHLRTHAPSVRFIVNKMPHNFFMIGFIKLMLPNAKIIHCCRAPEDTCLSIFKNYFKDTSHNYAYDLKGLGQYYALYQDLMEHWKTVLPDFIYDISYEDLVANQEEQSKALLAFLDLDWDPACLQFHKTARSVSTASFAQVRKPIYNDSVKLWKRYGKKIKPLLDVLRP